MGTETKHFLIIAGVGIIVYMWWKKNQETTMVEIGEGESGFSNIGGRRKRRKYDKQVQEMCTYCSNHNCIPTGCNCICGCPGPNCN